MVVSCSSIFKGKESWSLIFQFLFGKFTRLNEHKVEVAARERRRRPEKEGKRAVEVNCGEK